MLLLEQLKWSNFKFGCEIIFKMNKFWLLINFMLKSSILNLRSPTSKVTVLMDGSTCEITLRTVNFLFMLISIISDWLEQFNANLISLHSNCVTNNIKTKYIKLKLDI